MVKARRNKNKWLYWLGGAVLVVIIVVVIVVRMNHKNEPVEETKSQEVVQEEDKEEKSEEAEGESTEEKNDEEEVTQKEEIVQYEGEDPNDEAELSGVITYAGVTDGKLIIRVNIDQYLETGTCSLQLMRSGATIYTDTAKINAGATTATCEGFDVLTSELGAGVAQIQISLSADGKTGVINGEVEL